MMCRTISRRLHQFVMVLATLAMVAGLSSPLLAAVVADFSSSNGVAATGTTVDSWTDSVGSLVAAPYQGSGRPTLEANVFAGGQSGVLFDGSDDWLAFDDSTLPTGDYTVALAWKPANFGSAASRPTMLSWGNDQNNQMKQIAFAHRPSFHNPANGIIQRFNGSDANSSIPAAGGVNGTNYIGIFARNAATNDYYFTISDGTTTESETVNNSSSNLERERGRLGSFTDGGGDFSEAIFGGHLGRVIIQDSLLDEAGRSALLSSLNSYVVPDPSSLSLIVLAVVACLGWVRGR